MSEEPSKSKGCASKRCIFDWLDQVSNPTAEVRDDFVGAQSTLRPRGILMPMTTNIMATPERAGKRRRIDTGTEEPSTPLNTSRDLDDMDDETPRAALQRRAIGAKDGSDCVENSRPALSRRGSSQSLASSSSTTVKSSASRKSNTSSKLGILAELEVADIPLVYAEFVGAIEPYALGSQKLPADALGLYHEVDACCTGSGVIPGILKVWDSLRRLHIADVLKEELLERIPLESDSSIICSHRLT